MNKCRICKTRLDDLIAIKKSKCGWCKGYVIGFIDGWKSRDKLTLEKK